MRDLREGALVRVVVRARELKVHLPERREALAGEQTAYARPYIVHDDVRVVELLVLEAQDHGERLERGGRGKRERLQQCVHPGEGRERAQRVELAIIGLLLFCDGEGEDEMAKMGQAGEIKNILGVAE